MSAKQLQINARFDIKPLSERCTDHKRKVAVALLVLTQQHQMAGFSVKFVHLVKPGTPFGRNIHLTADNGLNPLGFTGAIKINGAIHHAVIRDRYRSLPHGLDQFRQFADPAGTIQETVLRMYMQMSKGHGVSFLSACFFAQDLFHNFYSSGNQHGHFFITPEALAALKRSVSEMSACKRSKHRSQPNSALNRRWNSFVKWAICCFRSRSVQSV